MPADREHDGAPGAGAASTSGPAGAPVPPAKPPRKIHRSSNQLQRNQACLACRRRRIKCDAARPHCGSCVRSYRFQQRTQGSAEMDCVYEDESEDGEDRGELGRLEAKIAQLEKQLGGAAGTSDPVPNESSSSNSWQASGSSLPVDTGAAASNLTAEPASFLDFTAAMDMGDMGEMRIDAGPSADASVDAFMADLGGFHDVPTVEAVTTAMYDTSVSAEPAAVAWDMPQAQSQMQVDMPPMSVDDEADPTYGIGLGGGADGEAGKLGGVFLDMIWPGWPPRLPTPAMLDHLVTTFFTTVASVPRILHRETFLARLRLPPTHANFPHLALLHAICACAARYTAAVYTLPPDETIKQLRDEHMGRRGRGRGVSADEQAAAELCFSDRHAAFARLEIRMTEAAGRRWVEIAQARVLLTYWCQQQGRWVDGWQLIGGGTRMAAPLGILSERTSRGRLRTAVIEPATEGWDREERRRLMTYLMISDSIVSASSGWANALQLDEMTAPLPGETADFEQGYKIRENPQSWVSPDLYSSHPVADSFILMAKGIFLMSRITKFVRKAHLNDDVYDVRSTDEFRRLDSDIVTFNLSFPSALRDPLKSMHGYKKGIDADLISAHAVSNVASITLHEPFADLSDRHDPSTLRLMSESRSILGLIYLLSNTSIELSQVLHPINSFYFFAGARTFVLFYGHALRSGNYDQAATFLSDINVFQIAFNALGDRFPIGKRHHGMVTQMLEALHADLKHVPIAPHPSGVAVVTAFNSPTASDAAQSCASKSSVGPPGGTGRPGQHGQTGQTGRAVSTGKHVVFDAAHPYHPETTLYSSGGVDDLTFNDIMDVRRGFRRSRTPGSGSGSGNSPAAPAGSGKASRDESTSAAMAGPKAGGAGTWTLPGAAFIDVAAAAAMGQASTGTRSGGVRD